MININKFRLFFVIFLCFFLIVILIIPIFSHLHKKSLFAKDITVKPSSLLSPIIEIPSDKDKKFLCNFELPILFDSIDYPKKENTLIFEDFLKQKNSEFVILYFFSASLGSQKYTPCSKGVELLNKLNNEYKNKDLNFLFISIDKEDYFNKKPVCIDEFIKNNNINHIVLWDKDNTIKEYLGSSLLPETILVDRDKKMLFRELGTGRNLPDELFNILNKY